MVDSDDSPHTRIVAPSLSLPSPSTASSPRYDAPVTYFTSIPWCNALLTAPDTHMFLPQARNPYTDQQDQFFHTLLGASGGMEHMLCFFNADDEQQCMDPKRPITRISTLYSLGERLTGISGILHGGVTMSMVDEAMSQIIELNSALRKEGPTYTNASVTGMLDIKFIAGVPAEGVVLATAWLESTERRKSRVMCELVDEGGQKLASVKSTWVSLMPSL